MRTILLHKIFAQKMRARFLRKILRALFCANHQRNPDEKSKKMPNIVVPCRLSPFKNRVSVDLKVRLLILKKKDW